MNKKKEKKAEPLRSMRIAEKSYQMLITLQSLRQLKEKKRIPVSKVLSDLLEREIERIEVEKGSKRK